ncbi:hypothetical protein ABTB41_20040, partial [Acinetobacter baumannii]
RNEQVATPYSNSIAVDSYTIPGNAIISVNDYPNRGGLHFMDINVLGRADINNIGNEFKHEASNFSINATGDINATLPDKNILL